MKVRHISNESLVIRKRTHQQRHHIGSPREKHLVKENERLE